MAQGGSACAGGVGQGEFWQWQDSVSLLVSTNGYTAGPVLFK